MKKIILGAASIACVLGLVACSSGTAASSGEPAAASSSSAVAASSSDAAAASAAAAESSQAEAEAVAEASAKAEEEVAAKAAAKAEEEAAAKAEAKAAEVAKAAKAEAKAKIDNAKPMSSRELARLVKKPDSAEDDVVVVYGEITQFDAATGDCIFRANIAHARMSSTWKYEHNSIFVGGDGVSDCPKLEDFVADDEVKITATSMGSYSYDTQAGGNTTVPKFKIEKISLVK